MGKDLFVRIKEVSCFTQASPCIQQFVRLIRNLDVNTKVMGVDIINNLIGKMMDVYDDGLESAVTQLHNHMLNKRHSVNFNKCLWNFVSQGAEACSQARCKYHCLHL